MQRLGVTCNFECRAL